MQRNGAIEAIKADNARYGSFAAAMVAALDAECEFIARCNVTLYASESTSNNANATVRPAKR